MADAFSHRELSAQSPCHLLVLLPIYSQFFSVAFRVKAQSTAWYLRLSLPPFLSGLINIHHLASFPLCSVEPHVLPWVTMGSVVGSPSPFREEPFLVSLRTSSLFISSHTHLCLNFQSVCLMLWLRPVIPPGIMKSGTVSLTICYYRPAHDSHSECKTEDPESLKQETNKRVFQMLLTQKNRGPDLVHKA